MAQSVSDFRSYFLSDDDWEVLQEMMDWLQVWYHGTYVWWHICHQFVSNL